MGCIQQVPNSKNVSFLYHGFLPPLHICAIKFERKWGKKSQEENITGVSPLPSYISCSLLSQGPVEQASSCTLTQTSSLRSSEKYCPTQRLGWFSSYALPLLLCSNWHTCYSFIHCNDWLSAVAKNMDFGVRLPRFKFYLLHLLFV